MERYTILCTKEQTRKALELGAPIRFKTLCHYDLQGGKFIPYADLDIDINGDPILIPPTAEQMLGWLEDQGFYIRLSSTSGSVEIDCKCIYERGGINHKIAALAIIDAALDYLIKKEE